MSDHFKIKQQKFTLLPKKEIRQSPINLGGLKEFALRSPSGLRENSFKAAE